MFDIFDTHAHYDDSAFDEDRDELIKSLREKGVAKFVNIGSSIEACHSTLQIARDYEDAYCALGIHPEDCGETTDADMDWIRENAAFEKCVAIGEIGLDYHWPEPDHDTQKKWFARQIELAKELHKPIVVHSRDAAKDTIDLMHEHHAEEAGGVIHCYSYSVESAGIFLDMGFYIGIGGVLTFKNAKKLKEVAEWIPVDRFVLETDCPYMAPEPFRGKRNDSSYIKYVIEAMAAIKGTDEDTIRKYAWENAHALYNLPL
ncbi:MAG: TatD family hydrolase [Lachnospiraceae bacterium]|nr:TatD family hydrolase [Lachnospiraceae bacterium]